MHRLQNKFILSACVLLTTLLALAHGYADEPINSNPVGFQVNSVSQDTSSLVITVTGTLKAPANVTPIFYLPSTSPLVNGALATLQDNPCATAIGGSNPHVCCLDALHSSTVFDGSAQFETDFDATGVNGAVCTAGASNIADPANTDAHFAGLLGGSATWIGIAGDDGTGITDGIQTSIVPSGAADTYTVSFEFLHSYLAPRALETDLGSAQKRYETFIGVVFATLSVVDNSVSITATQSGIQYDKSDAAFVSISTEQDRLAIDSAVFQIHQGLDSTDIAQQYVEVTIDYDTATFTSGTATDLTVMTDSLRWKIDTALPTAGWNSPCSSAPSITWKTGCLPEDPALCDLDVQYTASGTRIYFPVSSVAASATDKLYIQFVVALTMPTGTGTNVYSSVSAVLDLSGQPYLDHCTVDEFQFTDIVDLLSVSTTIGVTDATDEAITPTNDHATGGNNEVHFSTVKSQSYADAAMLIELDASTFFANAYAADYTLTVDSAIVFNFLSVDTGSSYAGVQSEIQAGTAYTTAELDGYYDISPTGTEASKCTNVPGSGAITDVIALDCYYRKVIVDDTLQTGMDESVYYAKGDTGSGTGISTAKSGTLATFVRDKFFGGNTAFATSQTATYLGAHCLGGGASSNVDNNGYRCLFIDPGYRWLSRVSGNTLTNFEISDKTIVTLLVSVRDASGNVAARRLLSFDSEKDSRKAHAQARLRDMHKQRSLTDSIVSYVSNNLRGSAFGGPVAKPTPRHSKSLQHGRSLLQSSPAQEEAQMDYLADEYAGGSLVVSNPYVNPYVNMAYLAGASAKPWQFIKFVIKKASNVPAEVFRHNVHLVLAHAGNNPLLPGIEKIQTASFSSSASGPADGRRLLSTATTDETVLAATIGNFTVIYKEYLQCVLDNVVSQSANLTVAQAITATESCASYNTLQTYITDDVNVYLDSNCGNGTKVAQTAECNRLLSIQYIFYPKINFDESIAQTSDPTLQFEISQINSEFINDEAFIYNSRHAIAKSMNVQMDRVHVEFKPTNGRRLLAFTYTMVVSVYPDTREGNEWPPENFNKNTFYSTQLRSNIMTAVSAYNGQDVTVDSSPVVTASIPKVSITHKFTAEYKVKISAFTREDTVRIKSIVAREALYNFSYYAGVAMDDVSVAGMFKPTTNTLEFTTKVGFSTNSDACDSRSKVHDKRSIIEKGLKDRLVLFTVVGATSKVTIEDGKVFDTNTGEEQNCGMGAGAWIAIIASIVVVLGIVLYMYREPVMNLFGGKHSEASNVASASVFGTSNNGKVIYGRII